MWTTFPLGMYVHVFMAFVWNCNDVDFKNSCRICRICAQLICCMFTLLCSNCGKSVSEVTQFVSSGTLNLNSMNQSIRNCDLHAVLLTIKLTAGWAEMRMIR